MNTIRLRSWIRRYGHLGFLMVGAYLAAYEIAHRPRRLVSLLLVASLCVLIPVGLAKRVIRNRYGSGTIHERLIGYGSGTIHERLIRAVKAADAPAVKRFLRAGADPNTFGDDESNAPCVRASSPALVLALQKNSPDVARILIDAGANVRWPGAFDDLPLHMAAERGFSEIVQRILDKGVAVDLQDRNGDTAFMQAATCNQWRVAELLLRHGADINHRNTNGDTALFHVARYDSKGMVKNLLDHGISVDVVNEEHDTALMRACRHSLNQDPDDIRAMLDAGANVNWRDSEGRTPLMEIVNKNSKWDTDPDMRIVQVLISHGADVNAKDPSGKSVLSLASDEDSRRALIAAGAKW